MLTDRELYGAGNHDIWREVETARYLEALSLERMRYTKIDILTVVLCFTLAISLFGAILGHNPRWAGWIMCASLIVAGCIMPVRFIKALFTW